MAGGQPFSVANLAACTSSRTQASLSCSTQRGSPRTPCSSRTASGWDELDAAELIRAIAALSGRCRLLLEEGPLRSDRPASCLDDDGLAEQARELVVVYEGFPHYGGIAGHDMEALAQGIRESADEPLVRHYIAQAAYLGACSSRRGIPIVVPVGAHAVFLDAKRFLPHVPQDEFPAQALAAALYLAGGVRSMERGIVSGQHGDEPYDGLELVRLTIPRRVYTEGHLAYVADVVQTCTGGASSSRPADDVRARAPALFPGAVRAARTPSRRIGRAERRRARATFAPSGSLRAVESGATRESLGGRAHLTVSVPDLPRQCRATSSVDNTPTGWAAPAAVTTTWVTPRPVIISTARLRLAVGRIVTRGVASAPSAVCLSTSR